LRYAPPFHKHTGKAKPFTGCSSTGVDDTAVQAITYIALAKLCMPTLAELFQQFKEKDEFFRRRDCWGGLTGVRCPDKAQVRVSSLGQVCQRSAAMEDRGSSMIYFDDYGC
jgi:hypothetical protein